MAKRAVLIGINKYQVPGADLQGCVNDVKNLKGALTTYYGFADKDIATKPWRHATFFSIDRPAQPCNFTTQRGSCHLPPFFL